MKPKDGKKNMYNLWDQRQSAGWYGADDNFDNLNTASRAPDFPHAVLILFVDFTIALISKDGIREHSSLYNMIYILHGYLTHNLHGLSKTKRWDFATYVINIYRPATLSYNMYTVSTVPVHVNFDRRDCSDIFDPWVVWQRWHREENWPHGYVGPGVCLC